MLRELAAYVPGDAREAAMTERLRAFVGAQAACFERTLAIGHVTGSAWIVDRAGTAALLTHHRKLDTWLQLGGHADGDADIRRVALREATEESGLTHIAFASAAIYDVDVHRIPARRENPNTTTTTSASRFTRAAAMRRSPAPSRMRLPGYRS